MDATTGMIIVILIFAVIAVAAFFLFRQRGKAEIKGPWGTRLKVEGDNAPPAQSVGIKAKGIKSREGGVLADDALGRGIDAENIDAKDDVLLTSREKEEKSDPKH